MLKSGGRYDQPFGKTCIRKEGKCDVKKLQWDTKILFLVFFFLILKLLFIKHLTLMIYQQARFVKSSNYVHLLINDCRGGSHQSALLSSVPCHMNCCFLLENISYDIPLTLMEY